MDNLLFFALRGGDNFSALRGDRVDDLRMGTLNDPSMIVLEFGVGLKLKTEMSQNTRSSWSQKKRSRVFCKLKCIKNAICMY